jgi:hypothetical protein
MNQQEYFQFLKDCHEKEQAITQAKNSDYSPQDDPFTNFRRYGEIQLLSRMYEKFVRIENIINSGKTYCKDEPIEDTIYDLSNYCHLLLGYLADQKQTQKPPEGGQCGRTTITLYD